MDWNQAMEEDRQAIKRIVATLFSLAVLAELLCHRSRPVRGFVLWILRYAEEVVRDFVLETALDCGMDARLLASFDIPSLQGGDTPADAMRLAYVFRALALVLAACIADGRMTRSPKLAVRALAEIARLFARVSEQKIHLATPQCAIERLDSS